MRGKIQTERRSDAYKWSEGVNQPKTPTMASEYTRSDEDLIDDYIEGDSGALRLLIERYHDPLIAFLTRLMGSRDAAEDVFQDTFLQIHQSLDTFDRTRRFKPWLFTIAANKGRDALRKRKRRQAVSLSTPLDADGGGELVDLLDIDIPAVGSEIEQEELSALVQRPSTSCRPDCARSSSSPISRRCPTRRSRRSSASRSGPSNPVCTAPSPVRQKVEGTRRGAGPRVREPLRERIRVKLRTRALLRP